MRMPIAVLTLAIGACAHAKPPMPRGAGAAPLAVPEGPRSIVVISDLHIGPGRVARGGAWHRWEDFRWAEDFAAFLDAVDTQGGGRTDLVLLGDTFELWQGDDGLCASKDANVGCNEKEALERLDRAIGDHQIEFARLRAFARSGENRVWFVPGNHDAAILFPSAGGKLVEAIAPGRCDVRPEGYWLSADGRIYAEHGHQLADDLNRYTDWPRPFVAEGTRLRRSWGEQFVRSFYNLYEARYPVIDNINSKLTAIEYGLAKEQFAGFGAASASLFRFLVLESSLKQRVDFAGEPRGAFGWDLPKIREQRGRFLVESFPVGGQLRALAEATSAAELDAQASTLTSAQIDEICRVRAQAVKDETRGALCPTNPKAGAIRAAVLSSRKERLADRLKEALADVRRDAPARGPFKVYVWGHTHVAEQGVDYAAAGGGWSATVVNSGAWQRVVTPEWFAAQVAKRELAKANALVAIGVDDLPACYSFVKIPPGSTDPELRYWTRGADGKGHETKSCASTCTSKEACASWQ